MDTIDVDVGKILCFVQRRQDREVIDLFDPYLHEAQREKPIQNSESSNLRL